VTSVSRDSAAALGRDHEYEYDVVVVGGGPAGASTAVFTARYGLDTVVFDRGRSSLQRCAHLENYLGFPAGIDIGTFYDLAHDHVEEAGCQLRSDMVESVERVDGADSTGFVVEPQEGEPVTTERVVAATRYDGEYLWSLGDDAMVTTHEHHDGEVEETFDDDYPGADGSTPIDGLYVASPSDADEQAVIAAGRGAETGRTVIRDARLDIGIPAEFADHYDWVRREAELTGEWQDRDRWREWFAAKVPDEHDFDPDELATLREAEIDRVLDSYVDDEIIDRRRERGHGRLLDHLDSERILDYVDDEQVLDHLDDERILERAREIDGEDGEREFEESAEAGD